MVTRSLLTFYLTFSVVFSVSCAEWSDFADVDDDGFAFDAGDCDDAAADVYPGAADIGDRRDNDCDGQVDEDVDADGDGSYSVASGGEDCDDADPAVHPGALEICNDGVDNDCDGGPGDCLLTGPYAVRDADFAVRSRERGAEAGADLLMSDITDDGFVDLLIYAPGEESTLRLIPGPIGPGSVDLSDVAVLLTTEGSVEALLAGGDADGDGVPDLLLGIPGAGDGGKVLMLRGGATVREGIELLHGLPGEELGLALAWIGPAAQPLLAIAAPGGGDFGAVQLWGSTQSQTEPQATLLIPGPNNLQVPSLTGGRDLRGEGSTDLTIGMPLADFSRGEVWVLPSVDTFHGDVSLADLGPTIVGPEGGSRFGWASAVHPDATGDGLPDLVVSAPSGEAWGERDDYDTGAIYIFEGTLDFGEIAYLSADDAWGVLFGATAGAQAGESLSVVPGASGGLLVGGDPTEETEATAWLVTEFVSGTQTLEQVSVRFDDEGSDPGGALVVAGGADLNADGLPDLAFGAPTNSVGGAVFVFFGLGL